MKLLAGILASLRLSSYRTEPGAEVDVIIESKKTLFAIEIKSGTTIGSRDLRGLQSFPEYLGKTHRSLVFYRGAVRKQLNSIEIWPLVVSENCSRLSR